MPRDVLVGSVLLMTVSGWYGAARITGFTVGVANELDRATQLTSFRPRPQTTVVFDRFGRPAFSFFSEQRVDVPLERVSPYMIAAIITAEDRRFFRHHGLDPVRVVGAAWRNLRAGRIVQGGSTITQQLARSALSPERTLDRKIREAALALRLEERYSKRQILQEYLNTVYFGEGYYGVQAAAHGYFEKSAADLAPAEAALLAGLVKSPSTDAPRVSVARAQSRRDVVLRAMHAHGQLSLAQLSEAIATAMPDRERPGEGVRAATAREPRGLYFQEEVRQQLFALFGAEQVLRGGLQVYSTFDPALQAAAETAIESRIAQLARVRPRAGGLQGSLVALDPRTGAVVAMVGGRSFAESAFNRATQARRQAGSAFKPIIFAAALEYGFAPGSLLRDLDTPIPAAGGPWLPAGDHEAQEYTLRRALQVSSNRAAARLLQHVGVNSAIYYARRLGISSELPIVPSLALGTGEVTLLELTSAYGVFANRGTLVQPRLITRVENAKGEVIWRAPAIRSQAVSSTNAYLMSSMLADVVSSGTAAGVRAAGFHLPAAGKTGTTDDYTDAWFIGYTPRLVAGVWFGFDKPATIIDRGFAGVVAVPAWAQFMRTATMGLKSEWYEKPADVERVAICRISGARAGDACRRARAVLVADPFSVLPASSIRGLATLRPSADDPLVYEDLFPAGAQIEDICPIHEAPSLAPIALPLRSPGRD